MKRKKHWAKTRDIEELWNNYRKCNICTKEYQKKSREWNIRIEREEHSTHRHDMTYESFLNYFFLSEVHYQFLTSKFLS